LTIDQHRSRCGCEVHGELELGIAMNAVRQYEEDAVQAAVVPLVAPASVGLGSDATSLTCAVVSTIDETC
jgi:hypothetical protein